MLSIYILKLEYNKYYIGKTINPNFRLQQHFMDNGSEWTKKYKPIDIITIIPNCDSYDEDKYTLKYMEEFGINNVRGGSFCQIILSDINISTIKQMINGSTDKCYICGEITHFAFDCKKKNNYEQKLTLVQSKPDKKRCDCITSFISPHWTHTCLLNKTINTFNSFLEYFADENDIIDKLKPNTQKQDFVIIEPIQAIQNTNNIEPSIDRFNVLEKKIDKINEQLNECSNKVYCCEKYNKEFNSIKGLNYHKNVYCNKSKEDNKVKKNKSKNNTCYRCGHSNHFVSDCYATTHIKGYQLK